MKRLSRRDFMRLTGTAGLLPLPLLELMARSPALPAAVSADAVSPGLDRCSTIGFRCVADLPEPM